MERSTGSLAPRAALPTVTAAGLVTAVCLATSVVLAARATEAARTVLAPPSPGPAQVADLVGAGAVAAGAVVAAWYAATGAAVLLVRLVHRSGRVALDLERLVSRWGAPVLRSAVRGATVAGLGLGVAVAGAAGAAGDATPPEVLATATTEPRRADLPEDLGWGAGATAARERTQPDAPGPPAAGEAGLRGAPGTRSDAGTPAPAASAGGQPAQAPAPVAAPTGGGAPTGPRVVATTPAHPGEAAPAPAPDRTHRTGDGRGAVPPGAPEADATHVVTAGESLWSIAETHLPPGSSAGDVALAWPRWYRANAAAVGPDPDLIHPGLLLRAPTEENP